MDSLLESKAPRNGSLKHLSEDQIALVSYISAFIIHNWLWVYGKLIRRNKYEILTLLKQFLDRLKQRKMATFLTKMS